METLNPAVFCPRAPARAWPPACCRSQTTFSVSRTKFGCSQTNCGPILVWFLANSPDQSWRVPMTPGPSLTVCSQTNCGPVLVSFLFRPIVTNSGFISCRTGPKLASQPRAPTYSGGCGNAPTQQPHRKPAMTITIESAAVPCSLRSNPTSRLEC